MMLADAQLRRLAEFDTATLYEASGLDSSLDPSLRPVYPEAKVVGRALPVRTHPADNLPLHLALEVALPGDVLVVDGRGELCGYWGEVLAVGARAKGVVGLVIDGGVRDTARLRELGFPVFSRGVSVRRTGKNFPGIVGERIVVGGVPVARGDAVVGDADGVVVLPADSVDVTVEAARARVDKEATFLERLEQGETTMSLYGFPHPLSREDRR